MPSLSKEINIENLREVRRLVIMTNARPMVICVLGKPRVGKSTFAPWLAEAISELCFGEPVHCYNLDKFPKIKIKDIAILEGIRVVSYAKELGYKPTIIIELTADNTTRKFNNHSP